MYILIMVKIILIKMSLELNQFHLSCLQMLGTSYPWNPTFARNNMMNDRLTCFVIPNFAS